MRRMSQKGMRKVKNILIILASVSAGSLLVACATPADDAQLQKQRKQQQIEKANRAQDELSKSVKSNPSGE